MSRYAGSKTSCGLPPRFLCGRTSELEEERKRQRFPEVSRREPAPLSGREYRGTFSSLLPVWPIGAWESASLSNDDSLAQSTRGHLHWRRSDFVLVSDGYDVTHQPRSAKLARVARCFGGYVELLYWEVCTRGRFPEPGGNSVGAMKRAVLDARPPEIPRADSTRSLAAILSRIHESTRAGPSPYLLSS